MWLLYTYIFVSSVVTFILFTLTTAFILKEDLYYPHPLVQDILWASLHKVVEPVLSRWPGTILREKALRTTLEHIHYEDENTRYICIGPVNKVCNIKLPFFEMMSTTKLFYAFEFFILTTVVFYCFNRY